MKKGFNKILLITMPVLIICFMMGCDNDSISINTTELDSKIIEAVNFIEGKEEGDQPGFYSNQTITKLQNKIEWAKTILENPKEQKQIDNAVLILNTGIENVASSEILEKYLKVIPGTSKITSPANLAFAPLDEFTVECRFKPASLNSNSSYGEEILAHIFCTDQQYVGANTGGYSLRYWTNVTGEAGYLQFIIGIGAQPPYWAEVNASYQFQELDKWYHLAITYNAATLNGKIYVDGVLVGEGTFPSPMVHDIANGGPVLGIGYSPMWDNDLWKRKSNADGQIIDFRIWGKELSALEINTRKDDFLTNISQYPSLNAYWPLNVQKGNPLLDATGNHSLNLDEVEWVDPN